MTRSVFTSNWPCVVLLATIVCIAVSAKNEYQIEVEVRDPSLPPGELPGPGLIPPHIKEPVASYLKHAAFKRVLHTSKFDCYEAPGPKLCKPKLPLTLKKCIADYKRLEAEAWKQGTELNVTVADKCVVLNDVAELEASRYGIKSKSLKKKFRKRCLYEEPFAPLWTYYNPPYMVCTRLHVVPSANDALSPTHYFPWDNPDDHADCETLPMMMEWSMGGHANKGIAIDVGASYGNGAFTLLNHGHEVHVFDEDLHQNLSLGRHLIDMTAEVNGWQSQIHYHGYALSEGPDSLDAVFKDYPRIDFLKIDVDNQKEIDTVLNGAKDMLLRTTCVQMELIRFEIGMKGKFQTIDYFLALGFDTYRMRDHATFNGRTHRQYDNRNENFMLPSVLSTHHGEPFTGYGQYQLKGIDLVPVCKCPSGDPKPKDWRRQIKTGMQHAFIRRGTPMHDRVSKRFGSCKTMCAKRKSKPQHHTDL